MYLLCRYRWINFSTIRQLFSSFNISDHLRHLLKMEMGPRLFYKNLEDIDASGLQSRPWKSLYSTIF